MLAPLSPGNFIWRNRPELRTVHRSGLTPLIEDNDLISARLLVPVDQDFPILGGKTLRVSAGVEMAFRNAKPVVILKGVSIMGIPIPNAWLGGLKNIDLISEFGDESGFWKRFAGGVENIRVEEGHLKIKLKE